MLKAMLIFVRVWLMKNLWDWASHQSHNEYVPTTKVMFHTVNNTWDCITWAFVFGHYVIPVSIEFMSIVLTCNSDSVFKYSYRQIIFNAYLFEEIVSVSSTLISTDCISPFLLQQLLIVKRMYMHMHDNLFTLPFMCLTLVDNACMR